MIASAAHFTGISPQQLNDLHHYAVGRLQSGLGQQQLAACGFHLPTLVHALHIGFIPDFYRDACPQDLLEALGDQDLANCLWLPIKNNAGQIVDGLLLRENQEPQFVTGQAGIISTSALADDHFVIITNNVQWLPILFQNGYQDVVFATNPEALIDSRIRNVTFAIDGDRSSFADTLSSQDAVTINSEYLTIDAKGTIQRHGQAPVITVADDTSKAAAQQSSDDAINIELIDSETDEQTCVLSYEPLRFAVELKEDGTSKRRLVLRFGDFTHRDTFDLAITKQIKRFVSGACRKTGKSSSELIAIIQAVWERVQKHEQERHQIAQVQLDPDEQHQAEQWMRAPDLLDQIIHDLSRLGWVGEAQSKGLFYLTAVSRFLTKPLWTVFSGSELTMPWENLLLLARLIPEEEQIRVQELTPAFLAQSDQRMLRHRLLLIDQAELLSKHAALALKVLHDRGGVLSGHDKEVRGPVAVLAAAHDKVDKRCAHCLVNVPVDESMAQTTQILEAQRMRDAGLDEVSPAELQGIISRHHALQRLLKPAKIVIPFADRIVFPSKNVKHRSEQIFFLTLIKASALLHQRQRENSNEGGLVIYADERDFHIALKLSGSLVGNQSNGLREKAQVLFHLLQQTQTTAFTTNDAHELVRDYDWTLYGIKTALKELKEFGFITQTRSGRGKASQHTYAVTASAQDLASPRQSRIYLRTEAEQAALMAVNVESGFNIISQVNKVG